MAWLHTEVVCPPEDGHHPSSNRARRRVTSLIRQTLLPLRQIATHKFAKPNADRFSKCFYRNIQQ